MTQRWISKLNIVFTDRRMNDNMVSGGAHVSPDIFVGYFCWIFLLEKVVDNKM